MNKIDLSLILPVQNQASFIQEVIVEINQTLKKAKIKNEIILVENGSTDETLAVLLKLTRKYPNLKTITAKKGYGSAIIAGLKISQGKYVSYMPSDGQLKANLLPKLYQLITTKQYDLVKIKRINRENLLRALVSKIFNLIVSLMFKVNMLDINASPRIFSRKWLKILNLQFKDSFIDCEMAIKAYFLKWKIKEVTAKTLPRLGGKSTVNLKTVQEFIKNLIAYRFGNQLEKWLQHNSKIIKIKQPNNLV